MQFRHSGSLRKLGGGLLAGIALVALSGCYPYYDGHGYGYYKQGHYSKKHHYGSGHSYYHGHGKYHGSHKRYRRKRYRHRYRY